MRLLLLSNSVVHGSPPYAHALDEIRDFCGRSPILFVPYALADYDAYTDRVSDALEGITVVGLHRKEMPLSAVSDEDVVLFVGGGNTFRLLKKLQEEKLIEPIRERIRKGGRYLGSSAGTVIVGASIRTTNDMPIVEPHGLAALHALPFHFNCHYVDQDPASTHMGESRELRLQQFHEENASPVLAMREGAWLKVDEDRATLGGSTGGRWFEPNCRPANLLPGADLSDLTAAT
jgi:dipeptidase E